MGGLFSVLIAVGVGSVVYLAFWLRSQELAKAWQKAAAAARLTDVEVSTFVGLESKLRGNANGLEVTVERYRRGKYENGTRVTVGGLRHGTYALTIRPEGVTSTIEKTFGEREIVVGDPAFDDAAYVQGQPGLVRAIFDAETRRALRVLLDKGVRVDGASGPKWLSNVRVRVSDSELRVDIRSRPFDRTEAWLPAILPQLLTIAQRLRRPEDVAAQIAANIRGEALEAVRLANLRTLTTEFPRHQATRDALVAALADQGAGVRLHAATALGPEGQAALLELTSAGVPDGVAAKAVAALGTAFPADRAITRLREAREAGHGATALACVENLGASGSATAVEVLVEILEADRGVLAAAAARALGKVGDARSEKALVAALDDDSSEVRVAAAETLGRIGTPLAVVPLREASAANLLNAELRRATRQAIAEIQSRVAGASPGQLSLAQDQAGQVSLVEEDTHGQVSLAQTTDVPQSAAHAQRDLDAQAERVRRARQATLSSQRREH
ncbi:MAG: HEAT repeat domain-containing protein [Vicinamibacterales bacterium]|nr:HEAT repeat domain-containing protein [Vicinamibacterales bacterium]